MTTHPNEVPVFTPSAEQLDQIMARTTSESIADRDAERRARAWPFDVEKILGTLADKVVALEGRIADLETRLGVARI